VLKFAFARAAAHQVAEAADPLSALAGRFVDTLIALTRALALLAKNFLFEFVVLKFAFAFVAADQGAQPADPRGPLGGWQTTDL